MPIRSLNADLRDALLREDSFVYAHLVKFERPKNIDGDEPERALTDYIYLTDGSFDISYDDTDDSTSNPQTYIANKVLKVGAVSETIEARATNFTLQIDATALNTTLEDSLTITTSTITSSENLVAEGFREGDIVELVASSGSNKGKLVRINSFSTNNTVANVTALENALTAETGTYTLTFKNPEVEGIITDRTGNGYARYINRDVFVYKAFINPETGEIIGEPYTLFKGIIAGGKIAEDPMKGSTVTWNITSHWGDFTRVQGRLTSDSHHRALDQNNIPDPEAAIRPAYTSDLGFLHSEQAINLVAIYQVKETRTKMKMKRKWYGSKKYKLIEYQVEVDREADLRFNLEAKYLPVVYGVNKIDSIPVFVDTLNNDAKQVFVAYAICEGQIGGLYDIYFDDTSSICIDENDKDTRSTQTAENTIDVLCQGRADRGDVLTSQNINSSNLDTALSGLYSWPFDGSWADRREFAESFRREYPYFTPLADSSISGGATSQGAGITHEKGTKFTTPIDAVLTFHAGKSDQKANSTLLSNSSNFKIATDYYTGDDPYWGAQHQLLDTAYTVAKYTIGEGETTIPSLDFVVRGKGVNCYNYDFSYADDLAHTDDSTAFNIGQKVNLKATDDDSLLQSNIQIADIYTITNINGNLEARIRFATKPALGTKTAFYLTDGTNNYHLLTYDHEENTGIVPAILQEEITSQANTTVSSGTGIDVTVGNGSPSSAMEFALTQSDFASIAAEVTGTAPGFRSDQLHQFYLPENYTPNSGIIQDIGTTQTDAEDVVSEFITVLDGIQLASTASSTNDAYNLRFIEVTHNFEDGSSRIENRVIADYDGTTKVAMVNTPFDQAPAQGDTYKIFSTQPDIRVSTNPAMQLLDYLVDDRFGRALDIDIDVDKESFFSAARECDTRSNIFMVAESQPTNGDEYYYEAFSGGKVLWQGTVKSSSAVTIYTGLTHYLVEFENVFGKIAHRHENWK